MKVISILNFKGGCGKTATAINLAYELSEKYKTLIIDLDPQGDVSSKFTDDFEDINGICEVLTKKEEIDNVLYKSNINDNLYYVPSKLELNDVEEIIRAKGQTTILHKSLEKIRDKFDLVIIDNNPNCPYLFINNIYATDLILIPIDIYKNTIKCIDYTIKKINEVVESTWDEVKAEYKIFFTKVTYSKQQPTIFAREVIDAVESYYGNRVLQTKIHLQSKAAQHQSFDKSYFPTDNLETSFGRDYALLSEEIESLLEKV